MILATPAPLWTCEPVLTEAAHLTGEGARILRLVSSRALRIGFSVGEQADEIAALMERYAPRMDLADACIVRMTELTRRSRVLTLDRKNFAVYRRNGRDVIPLVAPG